MIGNRKFIFGFSIVGIGIALDRFLPGGLTSNMLDLIKFVSAGFFLGNGIEHITGAIKRGASPAAESEEEGPDPVLGAISGQIEAVRQENAKTAAALVPVQQALAFIVQKMQGK